MTKRILTLPAQLRRSIAWDQSKEMAEHVQFTVDTGVQIYFCDPKSPWRHGVTRTPTDCSANTCRSPRICRSALNENSTPSPAHSTPVLDRRSAG